MRSAVIVEPSSDKSFLRIEPERPGMTCSCPRFPHAAAAATASRGTVSRPLTSCTAIRTPRGIAAADGAGDQRTQQMHAVPPGFRVFLAADSFAPGCRLAPGRAWRPGHANGPTMPHIAAPGPARDRTARWSITPAAAQSRILTPIRAAHNEAARFCRPSVQRRITFIYHLVNKVKSLRSKLFRRVCGAGSTGPRGGGSPHSGAWLEDNVVVNWSCWCAGRDASSPHQPDERGARSRAPAGKTFLVATTVRDRCDKCVPRVTRMRLSPAVELRTAPAFQ